jgi:hypothetical protein
LKVPLWFGKPQENSVAFLCRTCASLDCLPCFYFHGTFRVRDITHLIGDISDISPYNEDMHRLVGIETEYGLVVEGRDASHQMEEAAEVVRSLARKHAPGWDYRAESPRRDARGFTADRLRFDPEDAKLGKPGETFGDAASRSDRVLTNGARLYNDHGHPEYSTPECLSLMDLVAHDQAGERIVQECARVYAKRTGRAAHAIKNNTDHQGASYGTHENYLALRSVPFESYAHALLTFLATRILYVGSGKAGSWRLSEPAYQISQRADVFAEPIGIDTLYRRPLINTRDEPHADPLEWRRIHIIAGDANIQPYATALKVGATCLVLDLVEDGWQPHILLRDPVRAIAQISRDDSYQWPADTDKGPIGAIEIQRQFLNEAEHRYRGRDAQTDWTLDAWKATLDGLEMDPMTLADRLDWPAKLNILRMFLDEDGVEWGSDRLVAADLEYHNVDPDASLFACLETVPLVSEERIEAAMSRPPSDTRAGIRGLIVDRLTDRIEAITWGGVELRTESGTLRVDLNSFVGEPLNDWVTTLRNAATDEELLELLKRGSK